MKPVLSNFLISELLNTFQDVDKCRRYPPAAPGQPQCQAGHRADVYEQLKFCLYQDDAVTGLAMGLCELGSKSGSAIEDMVA